MCLQNDCYSQFKLLKTYYFQLKVLPLHSKIKNLTTNGRLSRGKHEFVGTDG